MNIPCPEKITCPSTANPGTNFSSEAADAVGFGTAYQFVIKNPYGWGGGGGPIPIPTTCSGIENGEPFFELVGDVRFDANLTCDQRFEVGAALAAEYGDRALILAGDPVAIGKFFDDWVKVLQCIFLVYVLGDCGNLNDDTPSVQQVLNTAFTFNYECPGVGTFPVFIRAGVAYGTSEADANGYVASYVQSFLTNGNFCGLHPTEPDAAAAIQPTVENILTTIPTRQIPNQQSVWLNQAQTCNYTCPDGTLFPFTCPAGLFPARTQIVANQLAHNFACAMANRSFICFGNLNGVACLNEVYDELLNVGIGAAVHGPITFSVSAGQLPPGVNLSAGLNSHQASLFGTVTGAGTFQFTIEARSTNNIVGHKSFTIVALGITNANPLPDAPSCVPYSVPLVAVGGTGPYKFIFSSDDAPNWLNLDPSTGVLSGTPTAPNLGLNEFSVLVTDANGITCEQAATVNVTGPTFLNSPAAALPTCYPYNFTLNVCPTSVLTMTGTMPPGLTWTNGVIAGTPTTAGTYTHTVKAVSGAFTATKVFTITVHNSGANEMVWGDGGTTGGGSISGSGANGVVIGLSGSTHGNATAKYGSSPYTLVLTINWTMPGVGGDPNTGLGFAQGGIRVFFGVTLIFAYTIPTPVQGPPGHWTQGITSGTQTVNVAIPGAAPCTQQLIQIVADQSVGASPLTLNCSFSPIFSP